ncbi:uncharacterized protein LOC119711743 isoform X1 [Motacilla alba alba]|uniref:uncharacterized protein LOC119711743 isoform X1 n=1 Tax=Motacilla alba alba TaxID=1094192 RepID=UPI0018D5781A|nr:uncharacterized protein LOC119711743 isoform X1 [Motacilla alba alba]
MLLAPGFSQHFASPFSRNIGLDVCSNWNIEYPPVGMGGLSWAPAPLGAHSHSQSVAMGKLSGKTGHSQAVLDVLPCSRLCSPGSSRIPHPRHLREPWPCPELPTAALGRAARMPREFLCGDKGGTGRAQPGPAAGGTRKTGKQGKRESGGTRKRGKQEKREPGGIRDRGNQEGPRKQGIRRNKEKREPGETWKRGNQEGPGKQGTSRDQEKREPGGTWKRGNQEKREPGEIRKTQPQMRHWGLRALPHPLESIREQFRLEIPGREQSRDGQTSNNADVWRLVWDRARVAPGSSPGAGTGRSRPGSSRLASFSLPPSFFQGLLKESLPAPGENSPTESWSSEQSAGPSPGCQSWVPVLVPGASPGCQSQVPGASHGSRCQPQSWVSVPIPGASPGCQSWFQVSVSIPGASPGCQSRFQVPVLIPGASPGCQSRSQVPVPGASPGSRSPSHIQGS